MAVHAMLSLLFLLPLLAIAAPPPTDPDLKSCGDAYFRPSKYTCYDGNFLCPIEDGTPTLRCGPACYLPSMYSCSNDELVYPPQSGSTGQTPTSSVSTSPSSSASATPSSTCDNPPTTQYLSDPPYDNYFYSDCHSANQVVVTSPREDSNLTIIGPRLLVAWPAGNSGVVSFFAPQSGVNGSLGIELVNGTSDQPLSGVFKPSDSAGGDPTVGVSSLISFNSSAILTIPIMGSIRNIRDFTEGPSILVPEIQDGIKFSSMDDGGVLLSRLWLDNATTSSMSFAPSGDGSSIKLNNRTLELEAGTYKFTASFNYPQLTQLTAKEVLNEGSQSLIQQNPDQTTSLSFLSYSEKLLAGAWRFLTYFGRDSMISLLLLQPVLSEGKGGAVEAVIAAVLERINATDGSVCHEETIGDYATYLNLQNNVTSTAAGCSYIMIDSDYYLPVSMQKYFVETDTGMDRMKDFLKQTATLDFGNKGMSYSDLAMINAEKIMNTSAAFAQPGGQVKENLIHLKEGQIVGEWRDSTYGIGGGRIPFDVNTALVPAALRSIATLAAAGVFPSHPEWNTTASEYAQIWEDATLSFFEVAISPDDARSLVKSYTSTTDLGFSSQDDAITSDVTFHGLALDGNNDLSVVKVMNTDDCFRHFLLNTTNQTQLTSFVNESANNILRPYPAGLSTEIGLLVANPAFGDEPVYAANWTRNAYHGTVVWSWQMSMMAAGLQRQLGRCTGSTVTADFCKDTAVHGNVLKAYNHLWDLIEANQASLSSEVWSWLYQDGKFVVEPLGALPPPPGSSPTESDVRQLWSLTFLAVTRDMSLK